MMKKGILIFLSIVCVLSVGMLFACSSGDNPVKPVASDSLQTQVTTVEDSLEVSESDNQDVSSDTSFDISSEDSFELSESDSQDLSEESDMQSNAQESDSSVETTEQSVSQDSQSSEPEQVVISDVLLTGQTTQYAFAQDFSDNGLIVTAVYSNGENRVLNRSEYTVNSSLFNSGKVGDYKITVNLNGENMSKDYYVNVARATKLHVLMIGNSFADDTIEYTYQIAKSMGITDVVVCDIYIGGCTLDTHYNNSVSNASAYQFRQYTNGAWTSTTTTMLNAIRYYNWDFITLQQGSGSSGIVSTYSHLEQLISYVKANATNPNVKLGWHMTWAYQQNSTHSEFSKYNNSQSTMYNAILNALSERVIPNNFFAIIPNGTAVQNARTSFVGDNLTRDGYHMSYDIGRYIAGLTFVSKLTGIPVSECSFYPSVLSAHYVEMCKESAQNALENPYAVTQSQYTTKPQIDLTQYVSVYYGATNCGYWNSADSTKYNTIITEANNSTSFLATEKFTRASLPVGSIIVIEDGWQYRPEGWIGNNKNTTRPDSVFVYQVVVTEAWWGNYTERAFNVSLKSSASLSGREADARNAFKIYLPLSNYTQMSFQVTPLAYWNSTLTSGYNDLVTGTTLCNNFGATSKFSKTSLPIGSIIIIEDGWRYRPEGWTGKGSTTNRPDNVTAHAVVVTEGWWENFVTRAFNISLTAGTSLVGREQELIRALKIYVPTT